MRSAYEEFPAVSREKTRTGYVFSREDSLNEPAILAASVSIRENHKRTEANIRAMTKEI
jgi:hypothetical protein